MSCGLNLSLVFLVFWTGFNLFAIVPDYVNANTRQKNIGFTNSAPKMNLNYNMDDPWLTSDVLMSWWNFTQE